MSLRNVMLTALIVLFILSGAVSALAQSDAVLFGQGRIALDQYHDCPEAEKAFAAVSSEGQKDPIWISYMARTEECLGNLKSALNYYERYEQKVPPTAELINKMGELRYKISKEEEAHAVEEQKERAAEARQNATEARNRAAEAADLLRKQNELAEARRHLPQTLNELSNLIAGKFDYYFTPDSGNGFTIQLRRKVISAADCQVSYHEDKRTGWWSHSDITFSLVGLHVDSVDRDGVYFTSSSVTSSGKDQQPNLLLGSHNEKRADSEGKNGSLDFGTDGTARRKVAELLTEAALACTASN